MWLISPSLFKLFVEPLFGIVQWTGRCAEIQIVGITLLAQPCAKRAEGRQVSLPALDTVLSRPIGCQTSDGSFAVGFLFHETTVSYASTGIVANCIALTRS